MLFDKSTPEVLHIGAYLPLPTITLIGLKNVRKQGKKLLKTEDFTDIVLDPRINQFSLFE